MKLEARGKWILAGEHAVLRGVPALVFPLRSNGVTLTYEPSETSLQLNLTGPRGEELKLLAWGVLENAAVRLGHSLSEVHGRMQIESDLPIGAGLGASAALCVVVARWCEQMGWIKAEALYEFGRSLEDLFHGESSGVDIAVALGGEGLKFRRGQAAQPVKFQWRPNLYLSFCGHRGVTADCVSQVKNLIAQDPLKGERLDSRMNQAVVLAEQAMQLTEKSGLGLLAESMSMALSCFEEWGLTEAPLADHLNALKAAGALAVKPTGSGGGGFVLSLWAQPPPTLAGVSFLPAL